MRPWLGYIRVSRVGARGGKLISPELQAERIRSYAEGRGLGVEVLDPELDVSGGKLERPILDAALERIENGTAAGIIVAQLDRLSRSIVHTPQLFDRVEAAGGEIIAVAEQIDNSTPTGRLQRNLLSVFADYELERYREGFDRAKASAVERGVWPVPAAPFGYRRGSDRRLEPDPDTAPLVVRAFRERSRGAAWSAICDVLGKGYSASRKIVTNRVYLGEVRAAGYVNAFAHEPLVSRALWEAAQISHPRPARGVHGRALLAGLVRCAGCRRTMTPDLSRSERLYRCRIRSSVGKCGSPALISGTVLEPVVERTFLAHVDVVARGRPKTSDLEGAQRELQRAEAELAAFQEATSALDADFSGGTRQRVEAVDSARKNLGEIRAAEIPAGALRRMASEWSGLGVDERRHLLGSAFDAVFVWKGRGPGRIEIVEHGFAPDLPSPGVSVPIEPIDRDSLPGKVRIIGGD